MAFANCARNLWLGAILHGGWRRRREAHTLWTLLYEHCRCRCDVTTTSLLVSNMWRNRKDVRCRVEEQKANRKARAQQATLTPALARLSSNATDTRGGTAHPTLVPLPPRTTRCFQTAEAKLSSYSSSFKRLYHLDNNHSPTTERPPRGGVSLLRLSSFGGENGAPASLPPPSVRSSSCAARVVVAARAEMGKGRLLNN